ncbi:short-chain dehydrogenase TIC 32, chloroplastic-like protein [Tanacetum coccineum]
MSLISSLPPFMVGGVGGRLVMLVSLGGRLFELMLIGLSRFRYLLAVFGLDKLQVKQAEGINITANSMRPGFIVTDIFRGYKIFSVIVDKVLKYFVKDVAQARYVEDATIGSVSDKVKNGERYDRAASNKDVVDVDVDVEHELAKEVPLSREEKPEGPCIN